MNAAVLQGQMSAAQQHQHAVNLQHQMQHLQAAAPQMQAMGVLQQPPNGQTTATVTAGGMAAAGMQQPQTAAGAAGQTMQAMQPVAGTAPAAAHHTQVIN